MNSNRKFSVILICNKTASITDWHERELFFCNEDTNTVFMLNQFAQRKYILLPVR